MIVTAIIRIIKTYLPPIETLRAGTGGRPRTKAEQIPLLCLLPVSLSILIHCSLHNNITNGPFFRPTVFLFGQKMLAVVKELQLEPGWKFKNRFYPEYVTKNFHP